MMDKAMERDEELEALLSLDGPGPAPRISDDGADALIAGAMAAAFVPATAAAAAAEAAATEAASSAAVEVAAGATVQGTAIKVAVILAAMGVGAAALWPRPSEPPTGEAATPLADETPADETAALVPTPEETPTAETPAAIDPVEAEAEADDRPVRRATPTRAEARDLLAEANRLRGARDYRAALRLYREASRAGGNTAAVARVAAGDLLLGPLGDAAGAARSYRRVRGRGPLAASALFGLARAERRLGRTARERAALERLVREHAGSPQAATAERRLQSLAP